VTGSPHHRLGFDQRTATYEAQYTIVSFVAIAAPILLVFAGWLVWGIVTTLHRQPFPADPGPHDYVFFAMFVGLLGSGAIFFTVMALSWLIAAIRREVALRIDANGVLLGREPFPPRRPVLVPWRDIEAIVTVRFVRDFDFARVPTALIALRLKEGAVRPPGVPRPGLRARMYWYPLKPLADVHLSIRGWHPSFDRIEGARRAFGPRVSILRLKVEGRSRVSEQT
jgi:hypothetical protein